MVIALFPSKKKKQKEKEDIHFDLLMRFTFHFPAIVTVLSFQICVRTSFDFLNILVRLKNVQQLKNVSFK